MEGKEGEFFISNRTYTINNMVYEHKYTMIPYNTTKFIKL